MTCDVAVPVRRGRAAGCGRLARWLLVPKDPTRQRRSCHVHLTAAVTAMAAEHDSVTVTPVHHD